MTTFLRDVRYALRSARRQPGITLLILLTLAVGIGSGTAIFTYFNWEYWHQVRAPDPDRLFFVLGGTRENPPAGAAAYLWGGASYQDALVYRQALAGVGELSLWTLFGAAVGLPGEGEGAGGTIYRLGVAVSPRHFELFGVRFALGRGFRPEENRPGGPRVAVVDHTFWRRYLGSDPSVVGRTIRLNSIPFTIVGVTPRGFQNVAVPFPIYVPTARIDEIGARPRLTDPNARSFSCFLRLPDGPGTPGGEEVEARLAVVAENLDREHPLPEDQKRLVAVRGVEDNVEAPATGVLMLVGAVGLLLLLACANVANLLLARAARRQREIAVLAAIGAGPGRIAARLLTESGLLAIAGGALGFGLARWLITVIKKLGWTYPVGFGSWAEGIEWMQFDYRVLLFTLLVSAGTGALFSLAPILHAARTDLVSALKGTAAGVRTGRRFSARQGLVVAQVALATVLLLGAGLLIRSLRELRHTELGFETEHQLLAVMASAPPRAGSPVRGSGAANPQAEERELTRRLYELGRQRLAQLPGVEAVTLASSILGSGVDRARLVLPERPDESFQVDRITIGPDFFETFGMALAGGRPFNAGDRAGGIGAAIVNQAFVERFWGGDGAHGRAGIGHQLRLPDLGADTADDRFVVVGVAADVRHASPREAPAPLIYLPLSQHLERRRRIVAVARTVGPPQQVMPQAHEAVATAHPDLALAELGTYDRQMAHELGAPRLYGGVAGLFSLFGLGLACLGVYSVMSCAVNYRRRELGIRAAVGASARDLVRLVLGEALRLVAAGIGLGVAGALALAHLLASLLYGVGPHDPGTFLALPLVLAAVGLAAAWLPAWRAGRVDPKLALQEQ